MKYTYNAILYVISVDLHYSKHIYSSEIMFRKGAYYYAYTV